MVSNFWAAIDANDAAYNIAEMNRLIVHVEAFAFGFPCICSKPEEPEDSVHLIWADNPLELPGAAA